MHIRLLIALLLLDPQIAIAENTPSQITTLGNAANTCGMWVQERQKLERTNVLSSQLIAMEAWITGFLTGANDTLVSAGARDVLLASDMDVPAAFAWIDNYCHAQPLNNIYNASGALMTELERKILHRSEPSREN